MMMTSLFVMLQVRIHEIGTWARSDERGQGTLEYVGMIAVAAILVGAVVTVLKAADVKGVVDEAVKKILGK